MENAAQHSFGLAGTERTGTGRRAALRLPFHLSWRRDLALPAGLLALQLVGATWLTVSPDVHHHIGPGDWALLPVGPLVLTVRRRHPVAAMWAALAATLGPSGDWFPYLSLIVAFFFAATSGHRRAAWAVVVAGLVSSTWLAPLAYGHSPASLDAALVLSGWLAVLVVAAEAVRISRERSAQAAAARQMDTRRRASEERLRMARDLHDVVGHNISLINLQAGVGLDLMAAHPDQARAALEAIRTASKEALGELRSMLSAFRQAGDEAPRSPAPGLSRLAELVEGARVAGLPVATEVHGQQRALTAAVDLAAYRIVQESLTNVTRHAGRAAATVRLTYAPGRLEVEVLDDGRDAASAGGTASAGAAGAVMGKGAGNGTGIAGMRERAEALGGWLEAGPRPGGAGFAVRAHLPTGGPAEGTAETPAGRPGEGPAEGPA